LQKKLDMANLNLKKTTWDLTPLFKSDDDPEMEKNRQVVEREVGVFVKKWKGNTGYRKNVKQLKQALDEYDEIAAKYLYGGDEAYYFELRTAQDQLSPELKAKEQKIDDFSTKLQNEIQFFELNLAKIDPKLQAEFLKEPSLKSYKHFLERLFVQAKHLLSDPEEKILNLKATTSYSNWVRMTESFLSKEEREVTGEDGKKTKKTLEGLLALSSSQKKKVRDEAGKALEDIFQKYLEVGEVEINSILANKKVDDELRGYKRPDQSRLMGDDMDVEVVDTVLEAVSSRNDLAKRYYRLKAKLLGQPKLAYHERGVEYGKVEKEYSLEEASGLVDEVMGKLDPEFQEVYRSFWENGQVDVFPKVGKRGGAACWHMLISEPSYILLNFTNTLRDVTTIAHEFGHGINNELMRKKQNALNFSTPTSTAEIASTFMEDFVLEKIRETADDELKLGLLMARLNEEVAAIFRQVACYKFEQELHTLFREKGYLSSKEIGQIFKKHMESYMGEASEGAENWWLYWSHIRTFFYVYSYASGTLISKSLQSSVRGNPEFIEKVKYFLSAGRSESPKQIFKNIGIDLTKREFWDKGLGEIEDTLKETEKLAKKLGKI
jgi:oligoendopeptidase F